MAIPRLKKKQLALYLEEEQYEALKKLSKKTRVSQQEYLREGLETVLKKYKKYVKSYKGMKK